MFKLTYIRQNAHGNRSACFYSFIEEETIITCPYGHTRHLSNNIRNGTYNLDRSSGQDKKFMEKLQIDDYIIIPIEKTKKCIIKKIISEPKVKTFENIFDILKDNEVISIKKAVNITEEEKEDDSLVFEPKRMYYRDCINIGVFEYDFNDKFPINSLGNIKNDVIKNFVLSKINIPTDV